MSDGIQTDGTTDPTGAAMVVSGVVALEGGATIARRLFPIAGVPGTVALRLGLGAALLGIRRRPAWPVGRREVALTVGVGLVLAVHHLAFYAAVDRLPLGVAVTLEFCGPLAVAIGGSRRVSHLAWTLLATAGVVLASGLGGTRDWDLLGVLLAPAAGACWAIYIVAFPRLRLSDDKAATLSTVTIVAAILTVPYGIAVDHAGMLTWRAVGLGALIALLADVTAYTLQAHALARLSGRVFSVLSSTEPAVGALFGLLALHQELRATQWIGVLAVCAAAAATGLGL